MEFYSGATLLSTDTSSPYTFAWTNIAQGNYSVTAKAFDSAGLSTTSSPIAILVSSTSGTPDLVSGRTIGSDNYTIELSGTNFAANSSVDVRTSTTTSVVATYSGTQLTRYTCGSSMCLSFVVTDASQRSFLNSTGLYFWVVNPSSSSWDGPVQIIRAATNTPPSVSLSASPTSGLVAPASTTLTAIASDAEGPISRVEFYNGTNLLGTDTSSPYTYAWTNIAQGNYSVTAKAFDSANLSTTSTAIAISVAATSSETPDLVSGRTIGSDNYTIELSGTNFAANSSVDVRTSATSNPPMSFSGVQLSRYNCGGSQCISFSVSDVTLRDVLTSTGLFFWVVNPSVPAWDGPAHVIGQAPLTYDQFAPYLSRKRGLDGGQNTMWRSKPFFSSGNISKIDVIWGSDAQDIVEQHEIRRNCSDGKDYVWISYYKQPLAGFTYPISARKVLLTRSGVTTDLTNVCGADGHVYALYLVDVVPYRIQVWGNTAPAVDAKPDNAFYWSANYQYLTESLNPSWADTATNKRAVIRQEEAWWAKSLYGGIGEWDRGASGPIGSDGEPTGLGVFNNTRFEIAKGAGFSWNWGSLGGSQTFGPYSVSKTESW